MGDNFLLILLKLMAAISNGMWYMLIIKLPREIGYLKFTLTCLGYLFFLTLIIAAVTSGWMNGVLFLILLTSAPITGIVFFRKQLFSDFRRY